MPKMYDIWQIGLIYREIQASVAALEALGTAVVRSEREREREERERDEREREERESERERARGERVVERGGSYRCTAKSKRASTDFIERRFQFESSRGIGHRRGQVSATHS